MNDETDYQHDYFENKTKTTEDYYSSQSKDHDYGYAPYDNYSTTQKNKNYSYDEFEDFKDRFEQYKEPKVPHDNFGAYGSLPDNQNEDDPFLDLRESRPHYNDKTGSNLADQLFWEDQQESYKSPYDLNKDAQW